jgi:hypothetical protein
MSWTAKVASILLSLSICSAGVLVTSRVREKCDAQKANVIPVKNHEIVQRVWIQV